ncbi:two-component system sensor histidine kinase DesK [Okibacterium sp. HSC-33S16]|uniref:sensor histidine kinase n=1 Tax=Okibacterium sp. HSC-33S16 TaxID=2910965 RepID=UPI00209FA059|nr:histidine kinase [Okibacterium sp. HSC-33S16]MCP2031186.1 two-component system sensor histidine kinase DesK [Okibacterium sp. HSC-33S16]
MTAVHRPDQARSVQTTWLYTLGAIVFFFVVLDAILLLTALANYSSSRSLLDAALVALILVSAAVHVRYCFFLRVGRGGGMPRTAWTVALVVPALVAWVLGLFAGGAGLFAAIPLWMAVNAMAPLLPKAQRWTLILIGAAVTIVHPIWASVGFDNAFDVEAAGRAWLLLTYGLCLPFMVLSSLWWWEIVVTLDKHRSVAAELAVAQERLRFASDLHDIQGHHLQVIALKSELAERMLAIDPDAAREHVHETRLIAKQALEETRSLVAGLREVDLGAELENAREVLTAAGADCELQVGAMPTNPEVRRVLALVVREATTNILRHSSASTAAIRLETAAGVSTLEIENNEPNSIADASARATSSGLAGLRDRVAAVNGTLETGSRDGHFVLRARVPGRSEG